MKVGARYNRQAPSGSLSLMTPPLVTTGAGTTPRFGLCTADGVHVYVANNGNGTIGQYSRNADGSLTALAPATVACNYGPYKLIESPDAKHIYCTAAGGDVIRAYSRNAGTGQLTLIGSYATGSNPVGCVISSDGAYVYVANKAVGATSSVRMYSRNSTTGVLTALAPASISFGPTDAQAIDIAMYGTSVYVGCFIGSLIYAFDQDSGTGQLTAAATASYTCGSKPAWLGIAPDGTSLYTANDGAASVSQFSRNTSTGALTSIGSDVAAGGGPYGVAITPDGKYVYIANSDAQTISQYSRNTSTGALTALTPLNVRSDPSVVTVSGSGGPQNVTVSSDGRNLYAYCSSPANAVSQFYIRP